MSKKDYTRYSNLNQPTNERNQNDAVQHVVQKPIEQEEQQPVQEVAEVVKSEPVKVEQFGVVTNCEILNVRERPSRNASILCMILCDSEVKIIDDVGGFYKVTTAAGVEGFCMKDYIDVRK